MTRTVSLISLTPLVSKIVINREDLINDILGKD